METTDGHTSSLETIQDPIDCPEKFSQTGNTDNTGNKEPVSIKEPSIETVTTRDNSSGNSLETTESTPTVLSYGDVIETTNKELNRLGWTKEKGIQYLLDTYNKKSRQLLSDEELLEFVAYLQSLPTPTQWGDCG